MWLFNSSIGKKVLMSVTGIFLVLFLTFHACMNLVAVFSLEGYNTVCEFLGSNWYAVVGTLVLAGGFLLHIVVASWLTLTNQKARGNDAYEIANHAPGVDWASKNMYILGAIVILGICLHLYMFWSKMMLAELAGCENEIAPTDGSGWIVYWFSQPVMVVLYLLWIAALWLHINHGIWSAFHTLGLNNNIWLCRWKMIAKVYSTIILGIFAFVVIYFFVATQSQCECLGDYLNLIK